MTPQQLDAMKLAHEALEMYGNRHRATYLLGGAWDEEITLGGKAITALEEALAEHAMQEVQRLGQEIEQEPVAWWNDTGTHIDLNVSGRGAPLYTVPPQRTKQKMVMWPCLIDTADFSKGTVTVVMQCEDYKVSAGTHWLSTTPPKENT